MRPHKIAFLISHPIQYMSPLFKVIAAQPNIELTVFYCSREGEKVMYDKGFGKEIKWDVGLLEGYDYKFLKNYSLMPTVFNAPFGLMNFGIIGEISREKYDAIIIHGWHYLTHWLAFLAAFLSRTPVFLRSEMPLNQELLKPKWKIAVKKFFFNFIFRKISAFLAIGTQNRDFYKFYGVADEKIFLMPYAVDNQRFIEYCRALTPKKEELKKEIGIPQDKIIILFCGKLINKKRPMDLLLAYAKIASQNKALIFLGDGELKPAMERFVKEKGLKDVYFAGFKNQSQIGKYYALADIFVLPSGMGETWGLAVNEAMCFGLPVIVSDLAGCAEDLVKPGENGYIFKSEDSLGLSERLMTLINDKELRLRMGKKSVSIISEWDYMADISGLNVALSKTPKEIAYGI